MFSLYTSILLVNTQNTIKCFCRILRLNFFGLKLHPLRLLPFQGPQKSQFQGPKKSQFQGPHLLRGLVMDAALIKIITYINSFNLMIFREPGFTAVIWFGSFPPLLSASCLSFSVFLVSPLELTREGGVGQGAKSYDGENAWSSLYHSILSGV